MLPPIFFDVLIGGLTLGLMYSLIAAGLNLQYGVTRILNVAHGEFLMLGAYTTFFAYTLFGVDPLVSLIINSVIFFFIGLLLQTSIFHKIIRESGSIEYLESRSLLVCFALQFIIQNIALIAFTSNQRGYIYATQAINFGGALFPLNRVITAIISLVISLALYLFLRFTKVGMAIRVVANEPTGAELVGINVSKMYAFSFGLGAILSAWTGSLLSMMYAITPLIGSYYTSIALLIIILGGLGNFMGSIASGLMMGYVSYIVMRIFSSALTLLALYIVFIMVLLIRPKGIFRR